MKLKEIIATLEHFAPLHLQESYDNSGLLLGDENEVIKGALLTLDCTENVVDEAIKLKCNLIIAHHPILFTGLKKLTPKTYVERVLIKAIKNNIAIYACHTNLDNIQQGVNNKIAEKLKLKNCTILKPKQINIKKIVTFIPLSYAEIVRDKLFEIGAGQLGNYSSCSFSSDGTGSFKSNEHGNPFVGKKGKLHLEKETKIEMIFEPHLENDIINCLKKHHPYEEVAYDIYSLDNKIYTVGSGLIGELEVEMNEIPFLKLVKKKFNVPSIKHTQLLNKKVKRIAICGGSGSFLLKDALNTKADVFITADFKYHEYFDAENKLIIADIGHFETEQYTPEIFYEILSKKSSNFALHLSKVNTNPVNYL
jgi:dinuclear metal center YbgI/SA1388 family protein